nr:dr1-associated corepressor-like [Ipomoea batatas]GMC89094.1 dr1-associated corepressor-like [Ipomoea batatas]
MQADEDVGKIAMAVPVLVSKALELFLQDLCDRTYDITLSRGAKTVNALHLKHCIQSYNVFDFLREVVSKVPDYGHSDTGAEVPKRRCKLFPLDYHSLLFHCSWLLLLSLITLHVFNLAINILPLCQEDRNR